jgi:ribosome-associated toxin RatA of RatAB toxin-antitoxin module
VTAIHRSALLPHSARQIYELVNDVEAYPQYMDGCVGARVLCSDVSRMEARLDLARGGIAQSFTTRNELQPYERITLALAEGPFEQFGGAWRFHALADDACKVSLDLEFSVRSGLLGVAAARLFDRVANNLVDAIVRRAGEVYR